MISDTYELLKRPLRVNFQKNPIASPPDRNQFGFGQIKGRALPCTSEGLVRPAQIHDKAHPEKVTLQTAHERPNVLIFRSRACKQQGHIFAAKDYYQSYGITHLLLKYSILPAVAINARHRETTFQE